MPLMSGSGITKYYGTNCLIENASFSIEPRDRIGLIGQNGTGKTTFLKMMLGLASHEGTIHRTGTLRISYLKQDDDLNPELTAWEAVFSVFEDLKALEKELHDARLALGDTGISDAERHQREENLIVLEHDFEAQGGHGAERRVDTVLHGLGIKGEMLQQQVGTLSGGERNRVALARLLVDEPDLWFLDEPTNHLDLDGIAFLETLLRGSRAGAVIISHDRRFLDDVTNKTWELENETLNLYSAGYSRSRVLRDERFNGQMKEYADQQRHIEKEESFVNRYHNKRVKEARGRRKRLARIERLDRPEQRMQVMKLRLPEGRRLGDRVLTMQRLAAGFDQTAPLISDLKLEVEPGEVLGVVGPNGAGKTTLLRILLGELEPLAGSVEWGKTVERGVLGQHEEFPESAATPLRFLQGAGIIDQVARDALGAMLFRGHEAEASISNLSGGERKRLMLTKLVMEGNNVLLLDEPTNHLDLASREALEVALSVFPGTIVVISHDRYFLDQLCDRILWLEKGAWHLTNGGYTEALAAREERLATAATEKELIPSKTADAKATGKSKKERNPLAGMPTVKLENRIIEIEEKKLQLGEAFADPEVYQDTQKLVALQEDMAGLDAELLALEEEYASRDG